MQKALPSTAVCLATAVLFSAAVGIAQESRKGLGDAFFEDVTHRAGIVYRHHPRRFDNPYASILLVPP